MERNLYTGIKVLDFTNNLAGPIAAGMMADFGADVIHIEKPNTGDDNRGFTPQADGVGFAHISCNRGKRSLVLDLKNPECIKIVKKLLEDTDVLIESFRPGVMDKLGLNYEEVKKIKKDIVYCSVSAYGQTGPYAKRPGYDVIAQAVSTIMYMTGDPDGPPTKIGAEVGDWSGGITAFGMIGTALYNRAVTGNGQHVDVSLVRALLWMSGRFDHIYTGGAPAKRSGNHHTTLAPYGIFCGNNDESIIIGALNQKLWTSLCNVMGRPELAEDEKFNSNAKRCENNKEMIGIIEDWLKSLDSVKTAEEKLMAAGVPCAKIYSQEDALNDPHYNECGWIAKVPAPDDVKSVPGRVVPAPPFGLSDYAPKYGKAPSLGQHNHEILEEMGYTPEQVDQMLAEWSAPKKK